MIKKKLDVSIIVVSFNTKKLTIECINSVNRYTKACLFEVIIIDNSSTDGSQEEIQKLAKRNRNLQLIRSKENLGFGGGNNIGMKKAEGRYILLLNSDTVLHEDSISKMVKWMDANSNVGVSTCKLTYLDGSTQSTGGHFPTLPRVVSWSLFLDDIPLWRELFGSYHPNSAFYNKTKPLDWVTGAFMLIKRDAYNQVGGFDTKFFMYTEDVEYSYRFKKKGWPVWFVPITSVTHIGGASSSGEGVRFAGGALGKERSLVGEYEGLKLFYKKHYPENFDIARMVMKIGALLRMFMFGFVLGQPQARNIYGKAFSTI